MAIPGDESTSGSASLLVLHRKRADRLTIMTGIIGSPRDNSSRKRQYISMIDYPSPAGPAHGPPSRLTLVLGAGGIRGLAHIGVLQALWEEGRLPDAVLGASSGALVASTYACLGWEPARIEALARSMGPLAILEVALAPGRLPSEFQRLFNWHKGWFAPIFAQMIGRRFEAFHHGVKYLGITCLDTLLRKERVFVNSGPEPLPTVLDAVLGSSALPLICPARVVTVEGIPMRLIDGGLSRTLPVTSAFAAPISAQRVLAVDLQVMTGWNERALDHQTRLQSRFGERLFILKPALDLFGTVVMKRGDPEKLVQAGRAAVTQSVRAWLGNGAVS